MCKGKNNHERTQTRIKAACCHRAAIPYSVKAIFLSVSVYLHIKYNNSKVEWWLISISCLQGVSGADQKGSSRHWRVQTNGRYSRKADRNRAPPTQKTEIRATLMNLSSLHPVTGIPAKHRSTHLDGSLQENTAADSLQFSCEVWCFAVHLCEPKDWESSAVLSGVNED